MLTASPRRTGTSGLQGCCIPGSAASLVGLAAVDTVPEVETPRRRGAQESLLRQLDEARWQAGLWTTFPDGGTAPVRSKPSKLPRGTRNRPDRSRISNASTESRRTVPRGRVRSACRCFIATIREPAPSPCAPLPGGGESGRLALGGLAARSRPTLSLRREPSRPLESIPMIARTGAGRPADAVT